MSGVGDTSGKLGPWAVWAIAVGGMVGGGIFSTLGVVISSAGVEIGIVVVKLAILAALAVLGLSGFDAGKLEIAS
ncbi:hypothetical protein [Qipengyuania oceanensis]|uniref:hypothetical protein n=1 Tax=Qipengyuania oceanensis TaxID=1463597 RepID=UPI001F39ACC2|nr:hypothetical protein [Qipengyuania oceanensis]